MPLLSLSSSSRGEETGYKQMNQEVYNLSCGDSTAKKKIKQVREKDSDEMGGRGGII